LKRLEMRQSFIWHILKESFRNIELYFFCHFNAAQYIVFIYFRIWNLADLKKKIEQTLGGKEMPLRNV